MQTLAEKRKVWLEVLSGKDRHSITKQITRMTWDATAFRVVNEARRLAPRDPDGGVQLNGLMYSLLDRAFFASHMATVRRLAQKRRPGRQTDKQPLWEGNLGVYSLSALLQDMLNHRNLLTRKAIFAAEGLEYDYEPTQQKFFASLDKQRGKNQKASDDTPPPPFCWLDSEKRHEQIDSLAGVQAQGRQPGDMVRKEVFDNLQRKVDGVCEVVVKHVNKFIAHAATPESRATVGADEAGLMLNHLWQAHQHLCEVASFLAIYVLGDSFPGPLPIPQYDQFKYIERPLIDASQVGKLSDLWRQIEKEADGWSQWGLDQYAKEFEGAS